MEYENDSTAVLVIDCQNDFCHPDGELYAEASEDVIPDVNSVIEDAQDAGVPVFYTLDTHTPDADEFEQWGTHCINRTWGHNIHRNVLESDTSRYVIKHTYDAFLETDLKHRLDKLGIENVILCGTLVNVCVQETASSANLRGYDVCVVEDAVGYINEEQKERALEHIEFLIGETTTVDNL
jgi:nicotinamidase-related amidase